MLVLTPYLCRAPGPSLCLLSARRLGFGAELEGVVAVDKGKHALGGGRGGHSFGVADSAAFILVSRDHGFWDKFNQT
jgi:hypothetical protein